MTDKLFSIDHEPAVISILLKRPELYYGLGLRFFMLSSVPHQIIFQEIEILNEKQLVADAHMVLSSLDSSGNLSKAGGKDYLDYIIGLDFNPDNVKEYASMVIASFKARTLLSNVSKIKPDSLTVDNVDDVIREFRNSLDGLNGISGGGGTLHISDNIKELFKEIVERTANPGIRGYSWGINDLDIGTGGKSPGDWIIIGARPSQGKSSLICNSILSDGHNGVPVLLFSKEMNYNSLVERLVAIDSGIPIQNIRLGLLDKNDVNKIGSSIDKIRRYPIFIDTTFSSDRHYMESTIQKYKMTKDIKVVYIDYLQLLSNRDDNQTHELGAISRACKLIANDNNICMVGVSQLNRQVEARDNKRPLMSDLRQSGNLEEDADFVVGLYRDEYYDKNTKDKNSMEFIVLKARNGPVGTIPLRFDPDTNKISGRRG